MTNNMMPLYEPAARLDEWPMLPLGNIAKNISRTFDFNGKNSVIFVNTGDVLDGQFLHSNYETVYQLPGQAKKAICKDDILISEIRPGNGRYAFVKQDAPDYVVSTKFMVITPTVDFVDTTYLYKMLTCQPTLDTLQRIAESRSGTFPQITFDSIAYLPIPVPSLPEQRAIAHVLGALDDKIELNRRMNATLETMAQTLFRSWFVDFDPVTAKAEGREPEGMDAETAALFPSALVESELGPIPEGWTVGTVADMCDINPSRKLTANIDAPYLDMANVPTHSARVLHVYNRPVGSGMKFQNGDTLVARITPCLENGKTAYVDFLEEGQIGWGSTEFIVLHPKPVFPAVYGYFLARTEKFRNNAIANMTGTSGRQRVPADAIARYKVVVPNAEVAGIFGTLVNDVLLKIQANDNQSSTLTKLRDELLPKLISGKLRLPEALVAEFADADADAPNAIK